jgi:hypothetical protein
MRARPDILARRPVAPTRSFWAPALPARLGKRPTAADRIRVGCPPSGRRRCRHVVELDGAEGSIEKRAHFEGR